MNCTMMTMMIRYERLEVEGSFAEYLQRLMARKDERAHSHRTMMTMMIRYERLEEEGSFAEYLQRLMTRKEERAHSHRTMMTMMIRYERLEVEGSFAEYLRSRPGTMHRCTDASRYFIPRYMLSHRHPNIAILCTILQALYRDIIGDAS